MSAIPVGTTSVLTRPATQARTGLVMLVTVNRAVGDTGVHAHTRVLHEGLGSAGVPCEIISPFTGSRLWAALFAVRPVLLHHLNKTWSTLWYRRWHLAAVRRNMLQRLDQQNGAAIRAVVAQCPVSARAALEARARVGGNWPVTMVCHFNYSEAREYRDKGELSGASAYRKVLAEEEDVLRRVDHVVYVSGWARDVVERERGIGPRQSTVVWNGLPDLPPAPLARAQMRASLGLADGELAMVNVGTLEPRKNQVGLVDLFAEVAAEFPQARLLLVGDGSDRSAVEARIAERKLQDKVRLLGMRRDVPAILAAADMYVHFAIAENCPVVLIEAARAGLPIAAAPVGGVPELMRELGSDVNLDLNNSATSLQALRPILGDANRRGELGALARQNFVRRFTRDAMVKQYLAAIEGAVPPVPSPGSDAQPTAPGEDPGEGTGGTGQGHKYVPLTPAAMQLVPTKS